MSPPAPDEPRTISTDERAGEAGPDIVVPRCPDCGAGLPDAARACPDCGRRLSRGEYLDAAAEAADELALETRDRHLVILAGLLAVTGALIALAGIIWWAFG